MWKQHTKDATAIATCGNHTCMLQTNNATTIT